MRSGREHLAWILVVEVRKGTLVVDGRGEDEEAEEKEKEATNIKSNNPHLAGGEKHPLILIRVMSLMLYTLSLTNL